MKRLALLLAIILSLQLTFNTAYAEDKYAIQVIDSGDFENGNTIGTFTNKGNIGAEDKAFAYSDGTNHCLKMTVTSDGTGNRPYYQISLSGIEGDFTFKGRLCLSSSHTITNAILFGYSRNGASATSAKLKMTYVSDEKFKLGTTELSIGEFIDVEYYFDMSSCTVTSSYNGVAGETYTASNFLDFTYIRFQPYIGNSGGYMLLDDVKITKSIKQSEIASINGGDDQNVACDSTGLAFEVSDPLPASVYEHPEHIKVLGGGTDLEASSITSDGNNINVVLSGKLESDTDYTLRISKEAYMANPLTDTAVDVEKSFRTAMNDFDIAIPSCGSDGSGNYVIGTQINNNEPTDKTVALIAVTYETDSNGKNRIVDIDANEYTIPANRLRYPVSVGGLNLSDNRFVKMYSIDGWAGKRPLFGKAYTKTYDDFVNPGA